MYSDSSIMEAILVESCEERMKLIRECISYKDPIGVKKLILEDKFNDETVHWELISVLGECINKENFEICSPFVEVCERCMKYIINVGSPKELLLALLEQADGFGDSLKFSVFLQLIQKTLLMLKSKQVYSLELSLETLSECLANLELPKDFDLEGEERRSHDLDPYVTKINEDIQNFLHFLQPFVNQIFESNTQGAEDNEMGRQKVLLLKYLLKMLEHPLVYLDLSITEVKGQQVKSNTRLCLEHLMSYLVKLQPDLGELIEESGKKNADILRRKPVSAVKSNEDLMQDIVPMLALSCLSYLKHVEGFGKQDMSCLFTKQGIMEDNLKFVLFLMLKPESEVRRKGVLLFQYLLGQLSEDTWLCYEDLDRPEYFKILDSLFDIMIFSSVRDLREQCLKIVPGFIQVFQYEARYQIFLKLFGTQTHSGAYGYCVQLFKNQIEELLCSQQPGSSAFSLFTGLNLKRIFLLITRLPEGPATDLVENSDRIIAVLNFIRYLVLRDPCGKNLTGFWDFFPHVDKEFLTPMMTGLDMSKGHYRLEMTGLEEDNTSRMTDEAQVEMSISVAGFKLPKMARGQKIAIFKQALNTLDLITSLLVRVNELIEQQKRSTRSIPGCVMLQSFVYWFYHHWALFKSHDGYFRSSEEIPTETEYEVKQRILRSSLPYVNVHGWTLNAIAAGADVEGLPGVAHGLFPRGGVELVFYFYTDCNRRLADQLAEKVRQEKEQEKENKGGKESGHKIGPFIRGAVETRLRMITPYIDKWPQAMGILALPQNVPEAFSNLLNLTDDIWYYTGDTSTDFNWYTKRITLAGVYKATEVFMVQDKSEDFFETWQFLDRRMADLNTVGSVARNGQQTATVLTEACKGMFIMARNVLGANSRSK